MRQGGQLVSWMPRTNIALMPSSPISNEIEEEQQETSFKPNQQIEAPQWFKDGLKNGSISFDEYGTSLNMSEEDEEKLDSAVQQYNTWCELNEELTDSLSYIESYQYYQSDMLMFAIWLVYEGSEQENIENLSWEEKYNLYKEQTGGIGAYVS